MKADDVLHEPVAALSEMVAARRLSPVELTQSCLRRIEAHDGALHSFVTVTAERALDEARRAEREIAAGRRRGPLHGIPYGAKDLLATAGAPTTWGARPYKDQTFPEDAAVVRRLSDAGAILIGKLAMVELAGGLGYSRGDASLTGAAHNPWNIGRWTCGSSSGAGAAVAAALVPFAIGSETWGSIVCPSSFCGVSGLRPTFGRVSRQGAMALSWTLDKLGPMARSAEDCDLVLRAIAGPDPDDPYSADEPPSPKSDPRRARQLRAGVVRLDFKQHGDPSIEKAFLKAVADLESARVRVEEAKLPDLPFESTAVVVLTAEAATAFEELERSGKVRQLVDASAPLAFVVSQAVRGADYVKAQRVRTVCQRAMAEMFERYDVLLFPSETYTAFPVDKDFSEIAWSDPVGAAGNLCGLPAVSVPCGFGADGLPAGLGMMSAAFDESATLSMARFYQSITDWHTKRPPVG